jgi:hypothetical protein
MKVHLHAHGAILNIELDAVPRVGEDFRYTDKDGNRHWGAVVEVWHECTQHANQFNHWVNVVLFCK